MTNRIFYIAAIASLLLASPAMASCSVIGCPTIPKPPTPIPPTPKPPIYVPPPPACQALYSAMSTVCFNIKQQADTLCYIHNLGNPTGYARCTYNTTTSYISCLGVANTALQNCIALHP